MENQAFPAGMELFPAADDEQFEFIKREIESSDYYVVLLAGRYGSVASDGTSFTEKEYDFAVGIGKPVLTFLHKNLGKLIGDKLESSDDRKRRLNQFREKAMKGRIVAFYENPDDLKAKVFHALVQSFNVKPMRGWVRTGQTSRTDLKRIAELQERVLQLESENQRLRRLEDDSNALLANGEHIVKWNLKLMDFKVNGVAPSAATLDVSANWDEMLLAVFPGGTSLVKVKDVKYSLAQWIMSRLPTALLPKEWMAAMKDLNLLLALPGASAVTQIFVDLHRQFTGLGLLTEFTELIYVQEKTTGQSHAQSVPAWRLTQKGEKYVALKRGFLVQN